MTVAKNGKPPDIPILLDIFILSTRLLVSTFTARTERCKPLF
jgi:hypothetical protein